MNIKLRKHLKQTIILGLLVFGLFGPIFAREANAASLFSGARDEACAAVNSTTTAPDGHRICDETALEKEGTNKVGTTLRKGINLLTIVVGVIAVVMIIISGLRYITANGDSGDLTTARNTFIYALVGLIIVAFAQLIVKLILTKIN